MQIGEDWMKWTLLEASTKTASKLLQKIIGVASLTAAYTFLATFIIGAVQTVAGFMVAKRSGTPLMTNAKDIAGAVLFGCFAVLSTVLGFLVFYLHGDIGVNVFIITLSIIPGALIDRYWFGVALSPRQWVGIALAIFAGYSVLGWPSLAEAAQLPLWVWLSFAMTFSIAINQWITQSIKKIDPYVKNFWGGATTLVLGFAGLVALGQGALLGAWSFPMAKFWLLSIMIGGIVVAMWNFNLLSYKGGASIALKKLVMNGAYLSSAMLFGVLMFGEAMTVAKGVGVLLYCVAFALMDLKTWEYMNSRALAKASV